MEKKGIKGTHFATELGISKNAISEWKSGKAKPSTDAVVKIANYFDVTTDYLLTGTHPKTQPPPKTERESTMSSKSNQNKDLARDAIRICLENPTLYKGQQIEVQEPAPAELWTKAVLPIVTKSFGIISKTRAEELIYVAMNDVHFPDYMYPNHEEMSMLRNIAERNDNALVEGYCEFLRKYEEISSLIPESIPDSQEKSDAELLGTALYQRLVALGKIDPNAPITEELISSIFDSIVKNLGA